MTTAASLMAAARPRWRLVLMTAALVMVALAVSQLLVSRRALRALDIEWVLEPGTTPAPDTAAAAADAVRNATAAASAPMAHDGNDDVDDGGTKSDAGGVAESLVQAVVDAGRAVVDAGKAVVDAGQTVVSDVGQAVLDTLGMNDVPMADTRWERPEAVWRLAEDGALAFELTTDKPMHVPVEVSLDTGVATNTWITLEGRIGGHVVIAFMATHGGMLLIFSFQPQAAFATYYDGRAWVKLPMVYPPTFGAGGGPSRIQLHVTEATYDLAINDTWYVRVPVSDYSRKEAFGMVLVRAYEWSSHEIEVVHVAAQGLPRSRVGASRLMPTAIMSQARQQPPFNETSPRLLVGVMSTATNYLARQAVRQSWFLDPHIVSGEVAVRFFVGHSHDVEVAAALAEEHRRYNDVIQISAPEAYLNVGYKTLAMAETLLRRTNATHLLKCDDDTFLRLDRILAHVGQYGQPPVYMGYISPRGGSNREPTDRYYIAASVYGPDTIPPFAHGPAYLVSRDILAKAVPAIQRGDLPMLNLEDVSMAVWVEYAATSGHLPVRYASDGRFRIFSCAPDAFNGHYISPSKMSCMWEKTQSSLNDFCCQ